MVDVVGIGGRNIGIIDGDRSYRRRRRREREKMIYRKWSLLTGPAAICGGIVVTFAIANYIFVKEDPFLKPKARNPEKPASA